MLMPVQIPPAVQEVNVTLVRMIMTDSRRSFRWTGEHFDQVHREYLRFLTLKLHHPDVLLVPSQDVDNFWHTHIFVDSRQYQTDCQRIFGKIVGHDPSMEAQLPEGAHHQAWENTLRLYSQFFREKPPLNIWMTSTPCGPPVY